MTGFAPFGANLAHHDFDVGGRIFPGEGIGAVDCGDLPFDEADATGNRDRIRGAVSKILDRSAVPILLGGDDSIPIPMFEAFAGRGEFTILQIDAHIDWRDEVQGERFGLSSTMRRASEMAQIVRIVQVGQRGIGSARRADYEDALAWGVHFVHAREVLRQRGGGRAPAHTAFRPRHRIPRCRRNGPLRHARRHRARARRTRLLGRDRTA